MRRLASTMTAITVRECVMTLSTWFAFSGRLGRAKFWLISLVNLHLMILVMAPVMGTGSTTTFAILALGAAVVLPSAVSAGVRRLHDRDRTGWWALAFYGTPIVIATIGARSGHPNLLGLFSLICVMLQVWGLVWLGILRGTVGPNRFGADPLQSLSPGPVARAQAFAA
jgi:uncharacterized membrane protein YhaH (DUF805 family)